MLVSVVRRYVQIHSTTYRPLKTIINTILPLIIRPGIRAILILATLSVVHFGRDPRFWTLTVSRASCLKPLAELARNSMAIINAFHRWRMCCR